MTTDMLPELDPPVYTITAAEFRMRCVAGWIENYMRPTDPKHPSRHGHAPSMREVGAYAGLSSSHSALTLVCQMRARGFVRWDGTRSRAVEVLEGPAVGVIPLPKPTRCDRIRHVVEAATGRSTPQLIALRTGIPRDKVASLLSYMAKAGMVHRAAFGEYLPAQRKAMV